MLQIGKSANLFPLSQSSWAAISEEWASIDKYFAIY